MVRRCECKQLLKDTDFCSLILLRVRREHSVLQHVSCYSVHGMRQQGQAADLARPQAYLWPDIFVFQELARMQGDVHLAQILWPHCADSRQPQPQN